MSRTTALLLFTTLLATALPAQAACPPTLDVEKRRLASDERVRLCDAYAGKVVLVVNTASKCGFTPQYDGLETLYRRYRERGLVVLGFPSNDFGGQEPGNERNIAQFCRLTYAVEFPMFEKTRAAEGVAGPFYDRLARLAGEYPRWNFHKYLLDRDGNVVASFGPFTKPLDEPLVRAIERIL